MAIVLWIVVRLQKGLRTPGDETGEQRP
jgi:hypothetical protein